MLTIINGLEKVSKGLLMLRVNLIINQLAMYAHMLESLDRQKAEINDKADKLKALLN